MSDFTNIADSPWLPLFEDLSDGIAVVTPGPWRLIYVNSRLARLLGSTPIEVRGREIREVFGGAASADLTNQLQAVLHGNGPRARFSSVLAAADGSTRPVDLRLHRLVVHREPMVGMIVAGSGLGPPLDDSSNALRRDPLTGLPDRTALLERVSALLGGQRAADRQFAVLFIDLDNFKQVNDAYGHLVGDRVLGEVARRLAGCVRAGDLVVRFGGDEFVALAERVSSSEEIQPLVERIHAAFAEPIPLPEGETTLSVSIGVANASLKHHTPEDLLRDADRAMYALKRMPQ